MKRTMPEIHMTLQPSPLLTGMILAMAAVSLLMIALYIPDWRLKGFLSILLLATTIYHLLRDGLRKLPDAWKTLQITAQGELKLTDMAGRSYTPVLANSTWIHPWLTILSFKKSHDQGFWQPGLPPLILLACGLDDCRKLRVWLRWWRHQEVEGLVDAP